MFAMFNILEAIFFLCHKYCGKVFIITSNLLEYFGKMMMKIEIIYVQININI